MVNIFMFNPSYFGALISGKINFPVEKAADPWHTAGEITANYSETAGRPRMYLNVVCAYFKTLLGSQRAETATNPGISYHLSF